ncbi:MAG: hypothetical protein AAFV09_13440 [Pseudomonadota bacterium]
MLSGLIDTAAAGGLLTVFVVTGLALAYARVFNAGRRVMIGIVTVALLSLPASQLLPASSLFRQQIAQSLNGLLWSALAIAPFALYGFFILRLRRRTGADEQPQVAAGVRLIEEDTALFADGEARRDAGRGAPADVVSLLYRGADGAALGAVRLRCAGDLATLCGLWADAPDVQAELIDGALIEARDRGARTGAVDLEPWEDLAPWQEAGFIEAGRIDGGKGTVRLTLVRDPI